jgi:ubiquinone biosynthesis protein COQ9
MTDNVDKNDVIRAMLVHVPFDGWTSEAMDAAADDLGIERAAVSGLFPQGVASAIDAFVAMSDEDMARAFAELEVRPQGVTATIKALIMIRLDGAAPYREAVSMALKALGRPQHAALGLRILYRTVDRMWRLAGDRSVDFNFYSKRALLAGVYSATLAYWAANPSADREKLERFVSQRLREVAFFPKVTAPARKAATVGVQMVGRMIGRLSPPWVRPF